MGLQLFGLTVSLVLGSRYVIPSDSHAGEYFGFLTVSRIQYPLHNAFNRETWSIPADFHLRDCFKAVCKSLTLMSLHCCSCIFALSVCTFFIDSAFSLKYFLHSILCPNIFRCQWWQVSHLLLLFLFQSPSILGLSWSSTWMYFFLVHHKISPLLPLCILLT